MHASVPLSESDRLDQQATPGLAGDLIGQVDRDPAAQRRLQLRAEGREAGRPALATWTPVWLT
jgi:hypothetical protein